MLSRFGLSGRVVLVVTTSFAVAAAVAWVGLDSDPAAAPAQPAPEYVPQAVAAPAAATVSVLAAVGTIEVGSQIAPETLTYIAMTKTPQTDGFLPDTPGNRAALSKQVAQRTIPAGTPFVPADLSPAPPPPEPVPVSTGPVSGTAALLTPGMRAISLPVTTEMAVAGLITRGDRLDIMVTYDVPNNMRAVRTVLRNVRVIATDQTTEVSHEAPTSPPKTVTLELHPEGAKVLALAMRTGNLVLVLSPSDGGDMPVIADDEPILSSQISGIAPSVATTATKSVRIIRGTAPSNTVMVPARTMGSAPGQIRGAPNVPQVMTVTPSN